MAEQPKIDPSLVPVKSSAVSHIGYDEATKTMTVRWHHGESASYAGVPDYVHAASMRAKSVGAFVGKYVVGKYKLAGEKK